MKDKIDPIKEIKYDINGLNDIQIDDVQINEMNFFKIQEKAIFNYMIKELLENVDPKEFIDIIKNDDIYNFVVSLEFEKDFKFNEEYYKKWKLKNKLKDF